MKRFIVLFLMVAMGLQSISNPIDGPFIKTSGIGFRRDPTVSSGGEVGFHRGVDYAAEEGTPVRACFAGIVIDHWPAPNGYYKGHPIYGGMIRIMDAEGITMYAHLSKTIIHEGDLVKEGEIIGYVGNTGKSTGPHLHLERLVELNFDKYKTSLYK